MGRRTVMLATIGSLLVDLIAFTIILPLFPSILQKYKENDPSGVYPWVARASQQLGTLIGAPVAQSEGVLIGGVLGSAFCFLQFLSSPIIGAISDVKGRRISLLVCLVSFSITFKPIPPHSLFPRFLPTRSESSGVTSSGYLPRISCHLW